MTPVAVMVGANRIVQAAGIIHPLGNAELSPEVTLLCQNEIAPEATFALIARAKARGARTILNLAPATPVPPTALAAVDVLVVNGIEAAAAGGGSGEPADMARALAGRHVLVPDALLQVLGDVFVQLAAADDGHSCQRRGLVYLSYQFRPKR